MVNAMSHLIFLVGHITVVITGLCCIIRKVVSYKVGKTYLKLMLSIHLLISCHHMMRISHSYLHSY